MERKDLIQLIDQLFAKNVKGQIQIDFPGDGKEAAVRFTNLSLNNFERLGLLKNKNDVL